MVEHPDDGGVLEREVGVVETEHHLLRQRRLEQGELLIERQRARVRFVVREQRHDLIVSLRERKEGELTNHAVDRRGDAFGEGKPEDGLLAREFGCQRGGKSRLAHAGQAVQRDVSFGGHAFAQTRQDRARHKVRWQFRDRFNRAGDFDGLGRRGGFGRLDFRFAARQRREFEQARGERGIVPQVQRRDEQRGDGGEIGQALIVFEARDVRFSIADGDAEFHLRQPRAAAQVFQHRAKSIDRIGRLHLFRSGFSV